MFRTISTLFSTFFLLSAALAAQTCNLPGPPVINSVLDGAAFRPEGFSINSLASIKGLNFAPVAELTPVGARDLVTGADGIVRFPEVFRCVAVEVNNRRAPILYTEPQQINFQIPSLADLGNVNVVVILNPGTPNERRSDPFRIRLDTAWPAAFRFGLTECVAAIALDGTYIADPRFVPGVGARKAKRGEIVTIFVTGLGRTEPLWQAGEVPTGAARVIAANNVRVELNFTLMAASDVLYAGLSPFSISGLQQINLRVPESAISGDNRIIVMSAGFSSQLGIVLPVE